MVSVRTTVMDGPSDDLLAGTGLPQDEQRRLDFGNFADESDDLPKRAGTTDQVGSFLRRQPQRAKGEPRLEAPSAETALPVASSAAMASASVTANSVPALDQVVAAMLDILDDYLPPSVASLPEPNVAAISVNERSVGLGNRAGLAPITPVGDKSWLARQWSVSIAGQTVTQEVLDELAGRSPQHGAARNPDHRHGPPRGFPLPWKGEAEFTAASDSEPSSGMREGFTSDGTAALGQGSHRERFPEPCRSRGLRRRWQSRRQIATLERRALAEHKPPAMAGSLLQNLGRRPTRLALWGIGCPSNPCSTTSSCKRMDIEASLLAIDSDTSLNLVFPFFLEGGAP